MQAHIELMKGVEAYRVTPRAAVRMIVVRQAENRVCNIHEDFVMQGNEALVAIDLDDARVISVGRVKMAGSVVKYALPPASESPYASAMPLLRQL